MINRKRTVVFFLGYEMKYYAEFNCINLNYCDHFSHSLINDNDNLHNDFILCQKSS